MEGKIYTIQQYQAGNVAASLQQTATSNLESGEVLFLPDLVFDNTVEEHCLFSPEISNGKAKNISFNIHDKTIKGTDISAEDKLLIIKNFMQRYVNFATQLVHDLLPQYTAKLITGRTSFRPVEIKGRVYSYTKDDTRLHVDAFPSTPVNNWRILRVFCNVNPQAIPRVWNLGEPFIDVANKFLPTTKAYSTALAQLLNIAKITKKLRKPYDHYMLQIHDNMKKDNAYQSTVNKLQFDFPAQSTWMVFTDVVSHAALSGQHLLEQTFYVPVEAMQNPLKSPLRILEQMKGCALV